MNVYKVRPMDLHAQSEHCGGACIAVVIATEHHVEVQHLKDLGQRVDDQLIEAQRKLSSESKRADDMMHRGDSWREMCDELEAKLKGQSLRLDSALGALTEIFQLADGISDDMTLPEIGTIALGAIQKPIVEKQ